MSSSESFFQLRVQKEDSEPDDDLGPQWLQPPWRLLGSPVALALVIGQSDSAIVAVQNALVYPQGLEFQFDIRCLDEDLIHDLFRLEHRRKGSPPDEFLRLGVEFANGRRATNVDGIGGVAHRVDEDGATLHPLGGSGTFRRLERRMWLHPLPDKNPFTFVCEWPAVGISLSRTELDVKPLIEATARTVELWPNV
jgi:hypothetical protein